MLSRPPSKSLNLPPYNIPSNRAAMLFDTKPLNKRPISTIGTTARRRKLEWKGQFKNEIIIIL
jgi:hypothetical protein